MDITILRDINEWWVTGRVNDSFLEPVPRKVTPEIQQVIDERQIILLEGPRRVGKTSIIFHIIQNLMDKGIAPRRIIYISLDDPLIIKEKFFEKLTDIIETHLIATSLSLAKEKIYLFLDEVTHLKDWELYIKRYYDQKYPFKFIVSSSAASFLVKKGRESLVGRLFRFNVTPFLFSEFLHLKSARKAIINQQKEITTLWESFFDHLDMATLFDELQNVSGSMAMHQKEIDIHLHQFLLNGGFPEFLRLKGERAIRQYFPENIVERVVYHDIPEACNVADRALLQNLLLYSVFRSGSLININEMAASYNATRQTISDYLYYLQTSMLIRLLEKYAKTEASRLRAFRKLYTVDTGLYIYLQRLTPAQIEARGVLGILAEIATFSQLNSYLGVSGKLFYFRERDMEVDFVVETARGLIPVEVKYRETPKDIKGIRYLMERFKAKTALVITKDTLKIEENILFVPLRLFLS
ncbi:MAG: ATP-binding protein [Thermodesulfobacteriota bacterium]